MTAGMLNALRRDALSAMKAARTQVRRSDRQPVSEPCELPAMKRRLIVQGERLSEAAALLACGADIFEWQPQCYENRALEDGLAEAQGVRPVLVLPAAMQTQELAALHSFVCRHAGELSGVTVQNIGQFDPPWPVPVWGGQGLNVMNAECARFLTSRGAASLTASCELSFSELRALIEQGGDYILEAYGRAQLMLLSHCPRRTEHGDETQDTTCRRCEQDGGCPAVYTDRRGYRFPARRLRMEHGCVVRLYNSVVTDMSKAAQKLSALGCSLRLAFTDETPERRREITASYRSLMDGNGALHAPQEGATLGHLLRGVE